MLLENTLALQVASILPLVLQHCSASLEVRTLCSLLQLNTTCRSAVQGSMGHFSITIDARQTVVAGLAAWLPKHAGLVSKLHIQLPPDKKACAWMRQRLKKPRYWYRLVSTGIRYRQFSDTTAFGIRYHPAAPASDTSVWIL